MKCNHQNVADLSKKFALLLLFLEKCVWKLMHKLFDKNTNDVKQSMCISFKHSNNIVVSYYDLLV